MKQRLKKILSVCMVTFCAVSLTAAVSAEDKLDETTESILVSTAEGLSEAIVSLTDEDIESYKTSTDDFTVSAMEVWESSKDELGELVEFGETTVEYTSGTYTATVPADFEKREASFVYTFDEPTAAPTSMSIDIKYPLSVTMKNAALNTIMGIGTVFVMLVFLSYVIYLMGETVQKFQKKPEKKTAPIPAPAPAVAAPVEEEVDDTELIAVIAAAIAAAEGTTPEGFVVRSVRKVNRRKW